MEIVPIDSVDKLILIILNILLLPLGIWILISIEYVANKCYERSKERAISEYINFYGFSIKGYTSVRWNKFVFRGIGILGILIGSLCTVYLLANLVNIF